MKNLSEKNLFLFFVCLGENSVPKISKSRDFQVGFVERLLAVRDSSPWRLVEGLSGSTSNRQDDYQFVTVIEMT